MVSILVFFLEFVVFVYILVVCGFSNKYCYLKEHNMEQAVSTADVSSWIDW